MNNTSADREEEKNYVTTSLYDTLEHCWCVCYECYLTPRDNIINNGWEGHCPRAALYGEVLSVPSISACLTKARINYLLLRQHSTSGGSGGPCQKYCISPVRVITAICVHVCRVVSSPSPLVSTNLKISSTAKLASEYPQTKKY